VLDYLMPGVNGYALAGIIYNNTNIPPTPVVILSSCDAVTSSQEMAKIDILKYLIKPVREQRLFDTLTRVLSDVSFKNRAQTPLHSERETAQNKSMTALESVSPALTNDTKSLASDIGFDILVAEDFSLNQDVVKLMLADTVFNPVFANNGQEAVDMFAREPNRYKIILMDISMPVMDGYEAAAHILKIQEQKNLSHTPIIALTGHALKHDREKCLNAGMDAYLTKPVKQIDLIETLEKWATETQNSATTQKSA